MIKFEDIANANKALSNTDIKGKPYVEVNQRIKAFRMVHPNGCINTEIISLEDGVVVMKATATDDEGRVIGTGLAYEKESSSYINKTSYIENCETSAVGRALGMCGFGIDTALCSADELKNALEQQTADSKKYYCTHCGKEITKQRYDKFLNAMQEPLCKECYSQKSGVNE